jgi:hypothetical protein
MESTATGHPDNPRQPATVLPTPLRHFRQLKAGVTFENDGLRARAEWTRFASEPNNTGKKRSSVSK